MEVHLNTEKIAPIEYLESQLVTHSFVEQIGTTKVSFRTLKLKDSLFVWVGSSEEPNLVNICLAMKSPYQSLPLTSQILGSQADDLSTGLASQLTRRLGKPVFASVNVQLDRLLIPEVTKRLKEEMEKNPEYF